MTLRLIEEVICWKELEDSTPKSILGIRDRLVRRAAGHVAVCRGLELNKI